MNGDLREGKYSAGKLLNINRQKKCLPLNIHTYFIGQKQEEIKTDKGKGKLTCSLGIVKDVSTKENAFLSTFVSISLYKKGGNKN